MLKFSADVETLYDFPFRGGGEGMTRLTPRIRPDVSFADQDMSNVSRVCSPERS